MNSIYILITTFLLTFLSIGSARAQQVEERVTYVADSISQINGTTITLLGGSKWELSRNTLCVVRDNIIIVFREIVLDDKTKTKVAYLYGRRDELIAKHIGGNVAPLAGILTTVVKAHSKGAVLELANGRLYSVPEYDQYDTGWWLPPYKALVTGNELYLWNLKEGKRIWVSPK